MALTKLLSLLKKKKPHCVRSEPLTTVVVHRMSLSDLENADLQLAHEIWRWQETTPCGQWVKEMAVGDLTWHSSLHANGFSYDITTTAYLTESAAVEFYLRWGKIFNECV